MGSRFLIISLWVLVAFLLVRACWPESAPVDTAVGSVALEDFSQPPPEDYPLVLENEWLRTEWSAVGASCGRVVLKNYTEHRVTGEIADADLLVLHDSRRVRGKVPQGTSPNASTYYRTRDAFRLVETSDVLLAPDPATGVKPNLDGVPWTVEEGAPAGELRFTWDSPTGVRLRKVVRLPAGAYHLQAEISVMALEGATEQAIGQRVALRLGTGGGISVSPDPYYQNPWVACALAEYGAIEDVEFHFPRGALPESRAVARRWTGDIPFVAEGSKYFLNAIRADDKPFSGAVAEVFFDDGAFLAAQRDAQGGGVLVDPMRMDFWKRASIGGAFLMHVGQPGVLEQRAFTWYVGPKDKSVLDEAAYGPLSELPDAADYGSSWFYSLFLTTYVAPVILGIMKFFHFLTGNWGIAIILLTILVRALVFPVTRHSQVKMAEYGAKMQRVKPLLDAVNQKYANDAKKKQEETMKLYQQHKLTPPIGGCLPMLLQMPVFIGLFAALRGSIDLRHQPFAFWIDDLSVPDALVDFGGPIAGFWPLSGVTALNLLPIVMVVLWIMHMRTMPKPTDPQQQQMQKIMTFMPLIFGIALYNYAAGLSLYMITSSAVGILEQKVIRKRWPVPPPALTGAVLPPAAGRKK